jgi:hypothetical protein
MSFTDEQQAEVEKLVAAAVAEAAAAAATSRDSIVGIPDVPFDAGPEYYVHLANGHVVRSHDSGSTHMEDNGETVLVTGRYPVGG